MVERCTSCSAGRHAFVSMKKLSIKKSLRVDTETLRALTSSELDQINGGLSSYCYYVGGSQGCTATPQPSGSWAWVDVSIGQYQYVYR